MSTLLENGTRRKIAVGMSGGIDSSVAAAMLMDQGHEVVGITAHMWREGSRCCSLEDVVRARRVCAFLGIPHYDADATLFFGRRIVAPFVEGYATGRTPSPCVWCNQVVKFGLLLRDVLELGCSHLATGHYARCEKRASAWRLLQAADAHKDQSYFLHRLDRAQLEHVLFPLGALTKTAVVAYARQRNLPVVFRSESQDLCFVPETGYAEFVEKRRPDLVREGPIVDTAGRVLGRHNGFHRFTIGQREGLGVASRQRLYVKELRPETNTVVVGVRDEIMSDGCQVTEINWIAGGPPADVLAGVVKLRYRHEGVPARIQPLGNDQARVTFDRAQFAVTPGQAAVFYAGEEVVGGGWIIA